MKITFLGHSCFLVETSRHRLLIDPFLRENPTAALPPEKVSCDFILISHGHEDHTADVAEVAKANNATIVANYEIAQYFGAQGLTAHPLNPGGGFDFPFGRATLTPAIHTSSMNAGHSPLYMGVACGIVIAADDRRIYHAGDTALFSDMKLIGRHGLDLAIVPIGDNFTMGPADAIDALDLLKPQLTIPMHYDTWELIAQNAQHFASMAAERGHPVRPLTPGETMELP